MRDALPGAMAVAASAAGAAAVEADPMRPLEDIEIFQALDWLSLGACKKEKATENSWQTGGDRCHCCAIR